jgi:hypothetical protein
MSRVILSDMCRRFRILAALIALFTFTASFAEQVWASTCDGAMEMAEAPAAMDMPGMDHGPAPDHAPAPAPVPDHDRRGPECPLAATLALTGGCIITFQPAARLSSPQFFTASTASALPAQDGMLDLLLAAPPFHPPKA